MATEFRLPITAALENSDHLIRVGPYVDELTEWLVIEPLDLPSPRLVLTVESTCLLLQGLTEQLHRYDGGRPQ